MSADLLDASGLVLEYRIQRGLVRRTRVRALDDVAFTLGHGETLAIVGESGSGKTSLARVVLRLVRPAAGRVLFREEVRAAPIDLLRLEGGALRAARRRFALVSQDPTESLNPRLPVGEAVAEPLRVHDGVRAAAARARAAELFERVGLASDALDRFPHEFSGGQCQRIAIARALVLAPKIVVLDEAVSALDVSVRAQILNLLLDLQRELGLAYLFITHDLGLARVFAERVLVMASGRVVEAGGVEEVLTDPRAEATRRLVAGMLSGDPRRRRTVGESR